MNWPAFSLNFPAGGEYIGISDPRPFFAFSVSFPDWNVIGVIPGRFTAPELAAPVGLEPSGLKDRFTVALYDGGLRNRSLIRVFMLLVVRRATILILSWENKHKDMITQYDIHTQQ